MRTRIPALALSGLLAVTLAGCSASAPETSGAPQSSASAESGSSAATLTKLSQTTGALAGGSTLTLTGENLTGVTNVHFGTEDAGDITVKNPTTIEVTVPSSFNYVVGKVPVTALVGEKPIAGSVDYNYEVKTDVDRQMAYLFKHWNNYNTAQWGDMNSGGGDCANFTSQGLIARGWQQNSKWSSPGVNVASSTESWRFVPTMDKWLTDESSTLGLTKLGLNDRDKLKVGDIGIFLWTGEGRPDHVMTVSSVKKVNGHIKVAFVSHNLDGDYRDLDELIKDKNAANKPGQEMKAWFYSVPETKA
ncbi:hypothetical protein D9V32_08600 [Mycetocola tolaasinivorans]|uniref:IPT/TIG domain-containing protein n=1 Tax=Mycetocola tolaasinivorans TaxID=76635 RepID=A0A3L7A7J0_9MICO|nr:amidase domain-containing protein [Mycetocola tolaasinivorans]RLP75531.1 hypothetical protein D9V32_08600 [Mycetocola tolaasinivorans]